MKEQDAGMGENRGEDYLDEVLIGKKLAAHVEQLRLCRKCQRMHPPVVSGANNSGDTK